MKKNILILSLACAMLAGCTSTKNAVADYNLRAKISWSAFCEARGYDLNDNTYLTVNEYLDAWCGSVEEEEALINAGVEPY